MARTQETENADPSRADLNEILLGSDDPAADVAEALDRVQQQTGKPLRKNGVRAVELFFGMSPDWAKNASQEDIKAWADASQAWAEETFGMDNLVQLRLHQDETTPHLTGFMVPQDPKTGRLNASRWFDGRKALSDLQTSYAAAMAPFGLERGIEGSGATHERVKSFYGSIQQPIPQPVVPAPEPPSMFEDRKAWAEQQQQKAQRKVEWQISPLIDQAKRVRQAESDAEKARKALEKVKKTADQIRELPLVKVLDELGFKADPDDKDQWRDDERRFRITTAGRKFYDHNASKGGGGSIDLTMQVLGVDYRGALSWLNSRFGTDTAAHAVAFEQMTLARESVERASKTRPAFKPPETKKEPVISQFLASRGLAQAFIKADIRTDQRNNIAFLMRDETGIVQGAELKGTEGQFTGLQIGSSRAAHFVAEHPNGSAPDATLFVTESAPDALAMVEFAQRKWGVGARAVSTSGTRTSLTPTLRTMIQKASGVSIAYDWDEPGQKAAKKLLKAIQEEFPDKESNLYIPHDVIKAYGATIKDPNDLVKVIKNIKIHENTKMNTENTREVRKQSRTPEIER